jgi:hypothetical protein
MPEFQAEWYEIVIRGHLDERRSAWFEGMTVTLLPGGETRLCGLIRDQAMLYGILSRLRDMGLPLLAVKRGREEVERRS